jgi:hypothetical protein
MCLQTSKVNPPHTEEKQKGILGCNVLTRVNQLPYVCIHICIISRTVNIPKSTYTTLKSGDSASYTNYQAKIVKRRNLHNRYRGAAHRSCNILLRQTNRIPVIMHGLRNYDAHFIIRELAACGYANRVRIIPSNSESYISFSLRCSVPRHQNEPTDNQTQTVILQFVDSFAFMSRSLAELVSNLPEKECHILRSEILYSKTLRGPDSWLAMLARSELEPDEILHLLRRKGCYPYDATSSLSFFSETALPPKASFCSVLTEEEISEHDYAHAQSIWNVFKMTNMGMYSDFYLMTDVLLLACVFEKFRQISFDSTGIDPAHHLSTPGFTWDACLKETGIELECVTDPEMYLMLERGIRGGLSQISLRHAQANNPKAAPFDFDSSKPTSWIMYYDVNQV